MDKTSLVASGCCPWNGTSDAVMEERLLFPGSRALVVLPAAPWRICLAFPASGLVMRVLGWPWSNVERFQIAVGHRRLGMAEFAQESALQKRRIPWGTLVTAQLKCSLAFPSLPVVNHTICLLCWAWGSSQSEPAAALAWGVTSAMIWGGHQERRDPPADDSSGSSAALWSQLGWGLAVLGTSLSPSIPCTLAPRELPPRFPFPSLSRRPWRWPLIFIFQCPAETSEKPREF